MFLAEQGRSRRLFVSLEDFFQKAAVSPRYNSSLINFNIRLTVHLSRLEDVSQEEAQTGDVPACGVGEAGSDGGWEPGARPPASGDRPRG